ncbi:MAG: alanine racemase [Oscillospiraceae bacterium]|nr:alanine racemase [Oscillospiraceae bacterium]
MNENYITVDLDAICHNLQMVKSRTGAAVCGVVKADAYGHGAVAVAKAIAPYCRFFGVSCLEEALELQNAGLNVPILILSHADRADYPVLVKRGIRPAIFTWEDALALSKEAQKQNVTAPFHFAVDTGMHRIGMPANEEGVGLCEEIANLPNLLAEGVFSHLATADERELTKTEHQQRLFDTFCEGLKNAGISPEYCHLNNSAASMRLASHYDMVRAGIVLYGHTPSEEMADTLGDICPAMGWYSKISYIKWLEKGCEISYGGTFTTDRPTRVATLPVGYGHGYPRSLSNRFYVLIRGKRAPILGRVCMDQMMVDVTDIPDVTEADLAVLVGTSGDEKITVEEISKAAGSFNYEFLCNIARRVPRLYYKDGELTETHNYLLD